MKHARLLAPTCLGIALTGTLFVLSPVHATVLTALSIVMGAVALPGEKPPNTGASRRTHGVLFCLFLARVLATSIVAFIATTGILHGFEPPLPSWMWFTLAWIALVAIMALSLGHSLYRASQLQHRKTERKVRGHCEKFLVYWAVLITMAVLGFALDRTGTEGSGHIPLGSALITLVTINAIGVVLDAHRDLQTGYIEAHDDELATARADHTERALNELLQRQRAQQNTPNPPRILRPIRSLLRS